MHDGTDLKSYSRTLFVGYPRFLRKFYVDKDSLCVTKKVDTVSTLFNYGRRAFDRHA